MKKIKLNFDELESNCETIAPEETNGIKGGDGFADWFAQTQQGTYFFSGGYCDGYSQGIMLSQVDITAQQQALNSYVQSFGYPTYTPSQQTYLSQWNPPAEGSPYVYSGTDNELVYVAEALHNGFQLLVQGGQWVWSKF